MNTPKSAELAAEEIAGFFLRHKDLVPDDPVNLNLFAAIISKHFPQPLPVSGETWTCSKCGLRAHISEQPCPLCESRRLHGLQRDNCTRLYEAVLGEGCFVGDIDPFEVAARNRTDSENLATERAAREQWRSDFSALAIERDDLKVRAEAAEARIPQLESENQNHAEHVLLERGLRQAAEAKSGDVAKLAILAFNSFSTSFAIDLNEREFPLYEFLKESGYVDFDEHGQIILLPRADLAPVPAETAEIAELPIGTCEHCGEPVDQPGRWMCRGKHSCEPHVKLETFNKLADKIGDFGTPAALASVPAETKQVIQFANAILHGDTEHREWLMAAANAFVAGSALPPPNGMGRAEAAEAKLAKLQELHDLVIGEVPELEKEGYQNIWGYLVHWDEVIKACNQAWPQPHGYSQSPLELIVEIINERDALKANPPQVDATLESIASELRNFRIGGLHNDKLTELALTELADRLSAHARKSQPGVNDRLVKELKGLTHSISRESRHIAGTNTKMYNGPVHEDAMTRALDVIRAAESAAPGENLERELADALNSLLDGLDENSNESGGLSAEQWHHRIASARLVLHRFDRMEQRSAARKTEGAKPTDTQPLYNYDERP